MTTPAIVDESACPACGRESCEEHLLTKPGARDYRDVALEDAAYELVWADERIRSLEADAAVYRLVAEAALDALERLTVRYDELRAEHDELTDEYRRMREDALLAAGVKG
jgi:chromosome segregation ATPase